NVIDLNFPCVFRPRRVAQDQLRHRGGGCLEMRADENAVPPDMPFILPGQSRDSEVVITVGVILALGQDHIDDVVVVAVAPLERVAAELEQALSTLSSVADGKET